MSTHQTINNKQRIFLRYIIAILIDLSILSLFNQYFPQWVYVEAFIFSLLAAILLQVLLQLTLHLEHKFSVFFFHGKTGIKTKTLRIISTWIIVFISKLVMLKAISIAFGESVQFHGPMHGVLAFIVVIASMIVMEQILIMIHKYLGKE